MTINVGNTAMPGGESIVPLSDEEQANLEANGQEEEEPVEEVPAEEPVEGAGEVPAEGGEEAPIEEPVEGAEEEVPAEEENV